MMELLTIGDSIVDGAYEEHSRFEQVINYVNRDHLLSVVTASVGDGPVNIVVRPLPAGAGGVVVAGERVTVDGQVCEVTHEQVYRSLLDDTDWHTDILQKNLSRFCQVFKEEAHPASLAFLLDPKRISAFKPGFQQKLCEQISAGVTELFAGQVRPGVQKLKGCGLGLTPSGDDFIIGVLLGLNALELGLNEDYGAVMETIYCLARGGNLLSNALLTLARNGRFYHDQKQLVEALFGQSEARVAHAAQAILGHGETSGADTASGLYLTLHSAIFSRHRPFCAGGHL
ncbi:MAG: DUF2877 domain-containing protein [Spartobacteria bacterium]|nr:DUF2877 domain-containing protein [Spartobacteria bacterium]